MIKHVCVRTEAPGGDTSDMYVAGKDQPEGGGRGLGTFFDNIEDALDLKKRMSKEWPAEKFEVFSLVKR